MRFYIALQLFLHPHTPVLDFALVSSFVFCIPTQSGAPVQVAHLRKLAYLQKCVYLRKVPYLPKVANLRKVRREFNFAEGI